MPPFQKTSLTISQTSLYSEYETPRYGENAKALKIFDLFPLALWLNNPANLFEPICKVTASVDSRKHMIIRNVDWLLKSFNIPFNSNLSLNDFMNAGEIHNKMIAVKGEPLEQALYMLSIALSESHRNIRYLFHWITLETLFGTDKGEVRFRIAQAIAYSFQRIKKELNSIYTKVKEAYDVRSSIAHGDPPSF